MRPKAASTPPPSPGPSTGAARGGVLFVELTGDRSRDRLERLASELPAEIATELLVGRDQPGLHLLVCRGAEGALDRIETPEEANAWRFGAAPASRPEGAES